MSSSFTKNPPSASLLTMCLFAVSACSPSDSNGPEIAVEGNKQPEQVQAECTVAKGRLAWFEKVLDGWRRVNESTLHIERPQTPIVVLFDEHCSFTFRSTTPVASFIKSGGFAFDVTFAGHIGEVRLPDGQTIPAQLTSFASPLADGTLSFVMAMPSIWKTSAKADDTEMLASAVFMHEFTHTQSGDFGKRIDALVTKGFPADANDDVIQTRFGTNANFAEAYRKELDLLFAAAAATDSSAAFTLARQALHSMQQRRANYFTGKESVYADAEDLFLTMEGSGQLAAYKWLVDPKGGGLSESEALKLARRDGRHWSQDEGIALFLVLERLDVRWGEEIFGAKPQTVIGLLTATLMNRPK